MHQLANRINGFKIKGLTFVIGAVLAFGATHSAAGGSAPGAVGAVFVSSNASSTNSVHMYSVFADGSLSEVSGSPFFVAVNSEAEGLGSGPGETLSSDPLASQNSIIIDQTFNLLFVVNAGDGSVSSFKIKKNKLVAVDTEPSGGKFPVSLTFRNGILYVVNGGGTANIRGFLVLPNGLMFPIPGTNIPLPAPNNYPIGIGGQPQIAQIPGQISFSPDGTKLLVLEKQGPDLTGLFPWSPPPGVQGPGQMLVYPMFLGIFPFGAPTINTFPFSPSPIGPFPKQPFVFTFAGSYVVVLEFFGDDTNGPSPFASSAVSSFALNGNGTLRPISVSVPNGQGGICWVARNGNQLYTTNNTTDNISLYTINSSGQLTLQNAIAATVGPGVEAFPDEAFPLDIVVGNQGKTLYQLTPGPSTAAAGRIHAFSINPSNGSLTAIGTTNVGTAPLAGQMGMTTLDY